jgi:drug/metabolite transporter (DMT)-like permease
MTARPVQSTARIQGLLIGVMAVWGLNFAAVKVLTESFDPVSLAAVRMLIAAAGLTAILWWQRRGMPRFRPHQLVALVLCAALMVYANQLLLAEGLLRSTATNGSLIQALSPLASSLMAALVFGERLTRARLAGVALGLAGVSAVVLSHPGAKLSSAGIGDMMLMLSVIAFSAGGIMVQRLAPQLDPLELSWAIYVMGALMLVLHAGLGRSATEVLMPSTVWPWVLVLFSGLLPSAIGNLIWNRAIFAIGAARTALFLYWVPIFGAGFAAVLLREALTWWHLVGFVAVMAGTWLGTRQPSRRRAVR